jgi:hypothetical protein
LGDSCCAEPKAAGSRQSSNAFITNFGNIGPPERIIRS